MSNYTFHLNDQWKTIGPGGGGAFFYPAVSPHRPSTAMVSTDMTGVFITHNSGETWEKLNLKTRIDAIAFDPVDQNTIYCGSSGIFRSIDGGSSWELIFPQPSSVIEERMVGDEAIHYFISNDSWPGGKVDAYRICVQAIKIDAENTDNIFIGLQSNQLHVFYSNDKGKTWNELCRLDGKKFYDLHIDTSSPVSSRNVYIFADSGVFTVSACSPGQHVKVSTPAGNELITSASAGFNPETQKSVFYIGALLLNKENRLEGNLWKSTDSGKTWVAMTSFISSVYDNSKKEMIRKFNQISTCANKAGCLYVALHGYPASSVQPWIDVDEYGILKSENEGTSWKWVLKGSKYENPLNKTGGWVERNYDHNWHMIGPKGSFLLGLGAAPSHTAVCYATDHGATYRTLNGGDTWEQVYSNDNPDGSVTSRGLDATTCYGVHFDPFDKNHIAISYTDKGFFHSKDGGKSWKHSIKGLGPDWGNTCYWMVFDPDIKGKAWGAWALAHDLPRSKMFRLRDLFFKPGGVARSDDNLETWCKSNTGMPDNSTVTHIELDPQSPASKRTLYAAVMTKGVYKSTDDGNTWELKNKGLGVNLNAWKIILLPDGTLYLLIARDLEDGSVIYDGSVVSGFGSGESVDGAIYRSVDGAENWERMPMPKDANAPNDIAFDPADPKRMYLACWTRTIDGKDCNGGVYITEDGGTSWINTFDHTYHVYGVTVNHVNPSKVYINTFNAGAFRSDDRGMNWKRIEGFDFKWGHNVIIDPHNAGMIYLTSGGGSVIYGSGE